MKSDAYLAASAVIFTLVALAQTVRLAQGWAVQIGPHTVPMAASLVAAVVAAAMAVWGFSQLKGPG